MHSVLKNEGVWFRHKSHTGSLCARGEVQTRNIVPIHKYEHKLAKLPQYILGASVDLVYAHPMLFWRRSTRDKSQSKGSSIEFPE